MIPIIIPLTALDARNVAFGLRAAALDALSDDRYVVASTYFELAATHWDAVNKPAFADLDRARARDALIALRAAQADAAELDAELED
jgi:hypothetical protein